jgi:cytochrome P450
MNLDFHPDSPREAYFDAAHNTWVLSRFTDVFAALREPRLRQVRDNGEFMITDDTARHAGMHEEVQAGMARMTSAEWRLQISSAASDVIARASGGRRIDIIREIVRPWSAAMLLTLSDMTFAEASRVTDVAGRLFTPFDQRGHTNPFIAVLNRWRAWRMNRAEREFGRIWSRKKLTLARSMVTGITHTLPGFLANAWLALLQHPDQAALLLANPGLAPNAVEELLRYAGTIHSLPRRASADVHIGSTHIGTGQHVLLRLDSANYDSERFPDPYRLDITRSSSGHVGLGTGPHICVGAILVRMATATLTPQFFAASPTLDRDGAVKWLKSKTVRWPTTISARLA